MIRYTIVEILFLVAGAIAAGILIHQYYLEAKEKYENRKPKQSQRCTFITAD